MPSASAADSSSDIRSADSSAVTSTVSACRWLNSATRATRSAASRTRSAVTPDSPAASGTCAHTRSRPGRAGLTVAYEPVREFRRRSTSSRLTGQSCSSVQPRWLQPRSSRGPAWPLCHAGGPVSCAEFGSAAEQDPSDEVALVAVTRNRRHDRSRPEDRSSSPRSPAPRRTAILDFQMPLRHGHCPPHSGLKGG
jgi:hypothetical protein